MQYDTKQIDFWKAIASGISRQSNWPTLGEVSRPLMYFASNHDAFGVRQKMSNHQEKIAIIQDDRCFGYVIRDELGKGLVESFVIKFDEYPSRDRVLADRCLTDALPYIAARGWVWTYWGSGHVSYASYDAVEASTQWIASLLDEICVKICEDLGLHPKGDADKMVVSAKVKNGVRSETWRPEKPLESFPTLCELADQISRNATLAATCSATAAAGASDQLLDLGKLRDWLNSGNALLGDWSEVARQTLIAASIHDQLFWRRGVSS
jgi:hypothetical protein